MSEAYQIKSNVVQIFDEYRKRADILFLQETHCSKLAEDEWRLDWGGRIIFSHGESNARGVAILFKKHFFCQITNIIADLEGRFIGL